MGQPSLALCDESKAEQFVTGGVLWLPPDARANASKAIRAIKVSRRIPPQAKIHCRVLFSGDARRRSHFSHLSPDDTHDLLAESVDSMLGLGALWFSAWVDRTRYPQQLQLVDGAPFNVGEKHLAGLACFAAITNMQHHLGVKFELAFDPDPTKIDWGLLHLQQATHFVRTHSNAIALPEGEISLLEMADICAYSTAQSLLSSYNKNNKRAARFNDLVKRMNIRTAEFAYTPRNDPSP